MQEKSDQIVTAVSKLAYSISGVLVASDWFSFIDHHAAAMGVILGFLTFLTNFVFQLLNHRAIRAKK